MKVKYRVLSVILSSMLLFMVGCTETITPDLPYVIQGAKVLRKASDYEISDLVDGNSEYFYNIFGILLDNIYLQLRVSQALCIVYYMHYINHTKYDYFSYYFYLA